MENQTLETLKAHYPDLTTIADSGKYGRITATKNIRKELKKAFPNIKFSVTSDCFSGGDSIDIRWENGPTLDSVRKITSKYQEGSFDGMRDLYEYSNSKFNDVFGGAKYVMEHRKITGPIEDIVYNLLKEKYTSNTEERHIRHEAQKAVSNAFLSQDYKIKDVILNNKINGWEIVFE